MAEKTKKVVGGDMVTGSMKNVGCYVRVSTDEQVESGTSLQMQIERTKAQAIAKGWLVYKVYEDGGFSGGNVERPALKEMLADMRSGLIEGVVIYKLDRLSRNLRDTICLLEDEFFANKVELASVEEGLDTSTSFGRTMINIMVSFAQLERDTIKERTSAGRVESAKTGKWSGGRIPYGYRIEGGQLHIIENEAIIIRQVFELSKVKANPHQVMEEINLMGYRTRNGKMFSRTHIANMLKNEYLYRGDYKYANGDVVKGQHEPILEADK